MTPAEHRAESERLLTAAKADVRGTTNSPNELTYAISMDRATFAVRAAAVHAQLAQAPATSVPAEPKREVSLWQRGGDGG